MVIEEEGEKKEALSELIDSLREERW